MALLFGEKIAAVGDNEAEVASARLVDARVIDFIEDPVAESEPDTAMTGQSGAGAGLRAGGPTRLDAGPAGGVLDLVGQCDNPCLGGVLIALRSRLRNAAAC